MPWNVCHSLYPTDVFTLTCTSTGYPPHDVNLRCTNINIMGLWQLSRSSYLMHVVIMSTAHRVIDAVSGCAALGAMAAFVKLAGNIRPESQTVLYIVYSHKWDVWFWQYVTAFQHQEDVLDVMPRFSFGLKPRDFFAWWMCCVCGVPFWVRTRSQQQYGLLRTLDSRYGPSL